MTPSDTLQSAVRAGELMPDSAKNIAAFLSAGLPAWAESSIGELLEKRAWGELNDRFYRSLEFGTGGIRGRTIASAPTAGETGSAGALGTPEHAASGEQHAERLHARARGHRAFPIHAGLSEGERGSRPRRAS